MTDFLEEAIADIDSVFFQEFVEQHKIDGKPFDVVPYEMTLKERKAHWEAGAKQNFDQGLYLSTKQFFIRKEDYGPKGWKADGVRRNLLHDQKLPDGARVVPGGT